MLPGRHLIVRTCAFVNACRGNLAETTSHLTCTWGDNCWTLGRAMRASAVPVDSGHVKRVSFATPQPTAPSLKRREETIEDFDLTYGAHELWISSDLTF